MSHKSVSFIALVLAVLLVVPTLILAATETISGMIESVDAKTGRLVVETSEDESKEVTAPKEMLQSLKPGDKITITVEEGTVQKIEKNDEES